MAIPGVSQRASVYLGTIHDAAIKTLIWCLEYQFDHVPIDRPAILKRLYQLFTCLMDRNVLTWQFFASRFETLVNEIQSADVGGVGRIYSGGGPRNNDSSGAAGAGSSSGGSGSGGSAPGGGGVQRGYSQDPLQIVAAKRNSQMKSAESARGVRSLSASLKYPYKRTISAPAGMGLSAKTTNPHSNNSGVSSTAPCHRQQSVPLLRGKISKDSGPGTSGASMGSSALLSKQGSNVATVFEEMEYANVASKTVDLDEVDKESIHLLVFLFMQVRTCVYFGFWDHWQNLYL